MGVGSGRMKKTGNLMKCTAVKQKPWDWSCLPNPFLLPQILLLSKINNSQYYDPQRRLLGYYRAPLPPSPLHARPSLSLLQLPEARGWAALALPLSCIWRGLNPVSPHLPLPMLQPLPPGEWGSGWAGRRSEPRWLVQAHGRLPTTTCTLAGAWRTHTPPNLCGVWGTKPSVQW